MTALTHIAGIDVQVGARLRQRCAWCGAVLIDYDLANIAAPVGQEGRPATWTIGGLVEVDGGLSVAVDHEPEHPLPDNACAKLDADVTR